MTESEEKTTMIRALASTVNDYNMFIRFSNRLSTSYISKGKCHYGFIPSKNTVDIIRTLLHIRNQFPDEYLMPRFLDIGCGIGNIVQIAYRLGFEAHGLEYSEKIYDVAKELTGRSSMSKVFKGDMLSFKKYHKYDVLYYYQPMSNVDVMSRFAKKLAKEMKPGAYVIPVGTDLPFIESEIFKKSGPSKYIPYFRKSIISNKK